MAQEIQQVNQIQQQAQQNPQMAQNPQMQQQMRAPLFEDKVVDYVFELATVTDKEVSKDELQKAVEAMDDE